jgi:hypothetical protein
MKTNPTLAEIVDTGAKSFLDMTLLEQLEFRQNLVDLEFSETLSFAWYTAAYEVLTLREQFTKAIDACQGRLSRALADLEIGCLPNTSGVLQQGATELDRSAAVLGAKCEALTLIWHIIRKVAEAKVAQ